MSFVGATGYSENQEQFDILKDEIDANASYINNLVGIPDPTHTAIFGINILNPGLFGLVERAEVKIKLLETGEETLGTDITGLTTQVEGIQSEILGIQGEITGIDSSISSIQFVQLPALSTSLAILIGATDVIAVDARNKANRSLDIWDYSGDNVYHKKSGNVGIGTTFDSVLTNKLEVNGNINIPTGSTFRIGDEPFNYTHLAGTQPVSSKWTNATDVDTNIYYNTGNVGIGVTTAINNKLEVAGNINIPTGSKYKINNVDLAFSDLGTLSYNSLSDKPTLFDGNYNSLTNKLTGGTNIQILNGAINNLYSYTLPTAGVGSGGNLGGVRVDNSTIFINGSGVISSAAGTPQVNSDWTQTNTSLKSFIQNKPTAGTNISLANNTITNIITGSPTQNIITLNDNYLIVRDKPDSQIVSQVDVPLTSANEPTITSPAFTESVRTFTHSGGTEDQTTHTITIGQNTICDILIVGGGGGGGSDCGGGGGGGGVIYATNVLIPANTYTIKVGKGGVGMSNGNSSEIFGAIANGGGRGGGGFRDSATLSNSGGSGGGGGCLGNTGVRNGGTAGTNTIGSILSAGIVNNYNGNVGGSCPGRLNGAWIGLAAGGGGAGSVGIEGINSSTTGVSNTFNNGKGKGGDGVAINITGQTYYWAAGGGGGTIDPILPGAGGRGGGGGGAQGFDSIDSPVGTYAGSGGLDGINTATPPTNTTIADGGNGGGGANNTGSGGGGGGYYYNKTGGNGGSGIVIIKFRTIVGAAIPEGNPITHKTLNFAYDNKLLKYDFTNYNTEATWKAYAATIPNFTYSLDSFLTSFDPDAVWTANSVVGWVQMTLPSTHNFLTITYGLGAQAAENVRLLINGVLKSSATTTNRTITYSQAYNAGDVVRIEETLSTMSANFIFQFTNTNPNTYTLSVQSGTSIQVNNGTAQYLSGNYTITVGATQSSVVKSGIGQVGDDPYPSQNGSTIAIRYSMLQRITSTINIKKDGLIKYVPASGTNPTTGTWNIIDLDTQPLTQFAGNLPANRLDNIDMSKVATGNLDWSRIASQPALSSLAGNLPLNRTDGNLPASRLDNIDMSKVATGNLDQSRLNNLYIPITNQFHRIVYAWDNLVDTQGIWTNKFRIQTNLHLNQYNHAYNYYQYFLSMSPNNVQDRHKYWFGTVKMSTIVGTDNPANTQWYLLRGDNNTFDIRGTSSTDGVWWLDIWTYTTAYCESLIAILH